MGDPTVIPLDHSRTDVASEIHSLMAAAYAVEADVLGVADFAPLGRTVAQILASETSFLGLRREGELVAVAELEDVEPGLCGISALVVDPARFREGLGTALLRAIVAARPGRDLTVSTGVLNGPALGLYAACGFRELRRWSTPDGIPMVTLLRQVGEAGVVGPDPDRRP